MSGKKGESERERKVERKDKRKVWMYKQESCKYFLQ